jgi:Glycosyltransferase sugar-binding region containing DXD motif
VSKLDPIKSLWAGDRLSTLERMCIESYQRHGHQFQLYTYGFVSNVPDKTIILDADSIVPHTRIPEFQNLANFSDYFRYRMLLEFGGIWVDLDNFCLKPYDFVHEYVFSSQRPSPKSYDSEINAGVLKVPARSEIMTFCVAQVDMMDTKTNHWSQIGPGLLMDAYHRFGLERYMKKFVTFCPLDYFSAPANVIGEDTHGYQFSELTYSVHLWNEEMRRAGVDKDADYPRSLYERLRITGR